MTDARRKRHVNVPSGPKKKETANPSSFKMSRPTTGRAEVPKPQPKPDPSTQRQNRREGGQGRQQGGRGPRQGGRQQGGRGRGPQQRRPTPQRPEALKGETWGRVIEHDTKDNVATVMAERSLVFVRAKIKPEVNMMMPNHRINIGTDKAARPEVLHFIGMARLDRMTNMARSDLPLVVQLFIEEHAQHFVDAFYNRAGPLSIKQHSFELLPDVGSVKAKNMVKAREQVGVFASMDELNAQCRINGAELLARRFVQELEDKDLQPRLTELLLPVGA